MFRHIIYAMFFSQLVNKTADCFNNIVCILVAKISSKTVCEKMDNNSTLKKVWLVFNRKAELLRLAGTAFDSKMDSLRRMRKKIFIILQINSIKPNPPFFLCPLLTFELSNINWKCSENCNMLNERSYDSAVFKINN